MSQKDLFGSYESVNPYEKKRIKAQIKDEHQINFAAHPPKNCSVCGDPQANWSSDFAKTWQCKSHRKW
jgi:hypothetical protein